MCATVSMNVTYGILVILALVAQFNCDMSDNGTAESDNSTVTQESVNATSVEEPLGIPGLYGGVYVNPQARNPDNLHYIHGTYQAPMHNYYRLQRYYRDDDSDHTLDYYLGFGISRMTNPDFQYEDFHWYDHDINRNISENESIPSEFIITCHPDAAFFCPENSETVCLRNGTIYCMSKISVVGPCPENDTMGCVNSTLPCVRTCIDVGNDFEEVSLPCLATVVIVDVYQDNKGKTLSRVGGTFVIVDALEESERTFCVTVIVDPKRKQTEG